MPDEMKEIHQSIAEPIAAAARGRAPVKTGTLKSTIKASSTPTLARVSFGGARTVKGKSGKSYAGPVHYGGYPAGYAGNRFVTDVYLSAKPKALQQYAAAIEALLKKENLT